MKYVYVNVDVDVDVDVDVYVDVDVDVDVDVYCVDWCGLGYLIAWESVECSWKSEDS